LYYNHKVIWKQKNKHYAVEVCVVFWSISTFMRGKSLTKIKSRLKEINQLFNYQLFNEKSGIAYITTCRQINDKLFLSNFSGPNYNKKLLKIRHTSLYYT